MRVCVCVPTAKERGFFFGGGEGGGSKRNKSLTNILNFEFINYRVIQRSTSKLLKFNTMNNTCESS